MIKLSNLKQTDMVYVIPSDDMNSGVVSVKEILQDINSYKSSFLYIAVKHHASLDAEDMLNDAIENECYDNMYEDWDKDINADITKEDIEDIQKILDRILARSENIAYAAGAPIEIDGEGKC